MKPSQPLSRHLLRAALMATLVPLLTMVALGLWQYHEDTDRVERFTGEESLSSARVVSNVLDFLVQDTRHTLQRMVHSVETGQFNEAGLHFESDSQPQTEGLAVTDAEGRIRMSSFGERGRDVSDLEVFSAVKDGAPIAYSDVFLSKWLRGNAVMIAMPYRKGGRFGGMVFARLNLPVLQRLLTARLDDPRLRSTYVVDRHGKIISHYDSSLMERGTNLYASEPVKAALDGQSGWMRNISIIDNTPSISGYVQMPGTGWAVVSSRKPGDSVLAIEDRLRAQLVLSVLAGLSVGLLAWAWGRRLTRPLEVLESTFRRGPSDTVGAVDVNLGQARLQTHVAEYQTLAEGYNRMAAELNGRFEEILSLKNRLQAQNLELNIRNDELAMLTNEAQAVNRLKDQFLATMSHELRTPLNSIIGFTELSLTDPERPLEEEERLNQEIVLKSARHLLALINDVLDLSKVEAGRMSLFVTAFTPETLLKSVIATAMPAALTQHVQLSLATGADVPIVTSDETKVRQILLNLVSNAVKFAPGGRVTVYLDAPDAEHWAVRVEDTGIGIAPEHQDLIFEEFRQVDGGPTRSAGGTGLGLSIARKLARLLGGDLSLESEAGRGSVFTLTLPREAAEEAVASATDGVAAAAPRPRGERQVLVIDDDPTNRHLIVERLRDTLNRPIPAGSREAALKLAAERRPDVVILDVKLRRQDDWDILKDLRAGADTAAIPVLVVSFEENRATAHALGATAFVTKPIDRRALLAALDRATLPVGAT